jgi:hypothetical protein
MDAVIWGENSVNLLDSHGSHFCAYCYGDSRRFCGPARALDACSVYGLLVRWSGMTQTAVRLASLRLPSHSRPGLPFVRVPRASVRKTVHIYGGLRFIARARA